MSGIRLPFSHSSESLLAVEAIMKAGEAVAAIYREKYSATEKPGKEPLTDADLVSNRIILEVLSKSRIPILSEESLDNDHRLNSQKAWIVDPLDGTIGFIKATGEFGVMIGLVEKGVPILGMVYLPESKALYAAKKGEGAYLWEKGRLRRLHVSRVSTLSRAHVLMSRFHALEQELEFMKWLHPLDIQQVGSCCKAMLIASGKADFGVAISSKLRQWDTCASSCIVTEAGGKMTDLSGNPLQYNVKEIRHWQGVVTSNGALHEQIVQGYARFLKS